MLDPKKLQLLRDVARTGTIAGAAELAGVSAWWRRKACPRRRPRADLGAALVPGLLAAARPGLTYLPVARPAELTRDVHITTRAADPSYAVTAMARCFTPHSPSPRPVLR